ncbi:small subunit ribosomal protein S16 [Actinobaculum suis]|uniref:Small ribosomal subunit protein bS16 n=1 Tax=Actinobaculum suis TaxID=1657 RepID=A0A1B9BED1_9ACTO|nr:30S ribosomal protein S16 [Actinobaculum suis]OCA95660.1 30S ribosomal protein S16 [Actinobaculum suis]OCA95861.1 30S ribosomal protein S16 [Actinobaculum suis]SDE02587.1 small subunit ribosomal protein S16 [Actinobaculum suis]
MTAQVAVKIRLKRMGKIRAAQYRVVVVDARKKRDGRVIEEIGYYDPNTNPSTILIDSERVQYWLGVGAQPSDPVRAQLKVTGDWQKFKGYRDGQEGRLRFPETVNKEEARKAAVAEVQDEAEKHRAAVAEAKAKEEAEKKAAEEAAAAEAAAEEAGSAEAAAPATEEN